MTKFEENSEEEKMNKIMELALQKCQESLVIFRCPHFSDYRAELKTTIDWIAKKIGMDCYPLYWDEPEEELDKTF